MTIPDLLTGYTIEAMPRDVPLLTAHAARLPCPAGVFIPHLPGDDDAARVAAAVAVRAAGFEPVPHIPARRQPSHASLAALLAALRREAAVTRVLLIAGDVASPQGPYADSMAVIGSGLLEAHGIDHVSLAGHPDDHPAVADPVLWRALADKTAALAARGIACEIVTQFAFDAGAVLAWLEQLRERGIAAPVRVGIPGPAGAGTLLRYARLCGVSASAGALARYGLSLGQLLGKAGPERFLDRLRAGLDPARHGAVGLHLFPFGGFRQTADWLEAVHARAAA